MSWQDTHLNTHTSHDGLISSVSSPSFSRFQITFLPLQHSRHVCIWTQTLKNPHTTYTHTHTHTPIPTLNQWPISFLNTLPMIHFCPAHALWIGVGMKPSNLAPTQIKSSGSLTSCLPLTEQRFSFFTQSEQFNPMSVFFFYWDRERLQGHGVARRFWLYLISTYWSGALTL